MIWQAVRLYRLEEVRAWSRRARNEHSERSPQPKEKAGALVVLLLAMNRAAGRYDGQRAWNLKPLVDFYSINSISSVTNG